ncbi:hypothetical protein CPB83DRAFT_854894 [Crepidotus variabilis]|uniref:Uncharacterized protein n=1 Tax=Crepidotus variabilis TaxID=179855 RepID=A0A9P6JPZ9_9AGAR|nr:hypothetical protein CPB83DRAFT_854894 [Crepidotus variabilis]
MSSTKAIKLTYVLNPPTSVESDKSLESLLPKAKSHEYPVVLSAKSDQATSEKDTRSYYTDLRKAIERARVEVGEELTEWRDIVGKEELGKEGKKGEVVVEVDEDEGEQEEEDV